MGAPLRKGRRADPSKDEAIIDAASALFAERGYGASIDEIAALAGVSKQTIYARYACKHDLLAAVIHRTAEDLVSPLTAGDERPEVALTAFGERFIEVVFDPRKVAMQRLIISEAAQFPDLARAYYENGPLFVRKRLADYIERAARAGTLDVKDHSLAASQFVGLIIGSDHMTTLMGIDFPEFGPARNRRLRAAVEAFLRLYALLK